MHLSVVVPTLNGRDRLAPCLGALAEHAPDAEVVVVNGPSTDGTTGMIRDRDDVDVLVEISDRNVNVARNAGVDAASGDAVALLDDCIRISERWHDAATGALSDGADAVTGPRYRELPAGTAADSPESTTVGGRSVTYFDGGNVALSASAVAALDGFDEYLQTGGARDAAHRLAGDHRTVAWRDGMAVHHDLGADGGSAIRADAPRPNASESELDRDWGWKYRSLSYRLAKNYGLRPAVVRSVLGHATGDAVDRAGAVLRGDGSPSSWLGTGRTVLDGVTRGTVDGLRSRRADDHPRLNPFGVSARDDRVVDRYDWR
jgi:glycosyltransferase involved in cell wall biosynthesis